MSKARTQEKTDKPLKFEEAVSQLEAIIEQIESGEVGLEDGLAQLERGMSLITHCRTVLSKVEAKIAELKLDARGELKASDSEVEGEIEEQ